jgi:hypothetical protein
MPPELLEPARAVPDFEGTDETAEWAQTQFKGREPLEGGLWLPLEVSHG